MLAIIHNFTLSINSTNKEEHCVISWQLAMPPLSAKISNLR